MARKTQISREKILEAACALLLREGSAAVSITAIARELGCSTQPVVWQFGSMPAFRQAFLDHCILRAKEQFTVWTDSLERMLDGTALGYIRIAREQPALFRFVFVENKECCRNSQIVRRLQLESTGKLLELLCRQEGLSRDRAAAFLMDYEFYVHGIASYTASGFCALEEEQAEKMVRSARSAFLAAAREV